MNACALALATKSTATDFSCIADLGTEGCGFEQQLEAALKALELRVEDTQKDRLGGKIEARRGDGTTVKVALEPKASDITLVRIRIGTFGDRDASERIGQEIEKRL